MKYTENVEDFLDSGHHQMWFADSNLEYDGEDYDDAVRGVLAEHLGYAYDDIDDTNGCDFETDILKTDGSLVVVTYEPYQTGFSDGKMIELAKIVCHGTITENSDIKVTSITVQSWE